MFPRPVRYLSVLQALFLIFIVSGTALAQASVVGQWSAVENWPFRPVHAHLMPTGKVLFWSYYNEALTPQIWDPATDAVTPAANIGYSIFCGGHSFLADGSLMVTGGHVADYVGYTHSSIYNPFTNTWSSGPEMNAGRWYPTDTTLPNGDVLVTSGDMDSNTNVNTLPQVYQVASGTWRDLTAAQLALPLYPRMFIAPNGKAFEAGPDPGSRYLDTSGTGAWSAVVSTMNFTAWRDYGPAVMYDSGKIMTAGGGDPPTATAETIDLNSATPKWTLTGSMSVARRQNNATLLPDGTVLVTGGSSGSGFDNSASPTESSEIWDPNTGKFTVVASQSVYRGYHSVALLLPDGRVMSGGGNVGGPNVQIYSPPYLFKGTRPAINNVPGAVGYGGSFTARTANPSTITDVTLIRMGSVTHSFNMDQRLLHLPFTATATGLNITGPASANVAPPGYYMLFAVASGIPSVASIMQVSAASASVGTITGQVTDSNSQALSGATVSYSGGSATTDASGNYTLDNVPAGSVQITASLTGFASSSETVTVTAGTTTTASVIALSVQQTGTVAGQVTASGSPVAGATVAYSGGSATTDASGNYTLSGVPAGAPIAITASLSGFQTASQQVTPAANATTTLNFVLTTAAFGSIIGRVVDSNNNGVASASVAYGGGTTSTDCSGYYSFSNVPAGTVTVEVTATNFQAAQQNVTVSGGATAVASFALTAVAPPPPPPTTTGTLTGTITRVGSTQALSGATVSYSGGQAVANTSGVYTLNNVPAGAVSVTASLNGYLPRTLSFTVQSNASTTGNIQLSTAGKVAGKVTSSSGAAVANATVTITGGGIPTTVTLKTGSTGTYATNWIPIGSYSVTASLTGHTTQKKTTTVSSGVAATVNFTAF
jgi:cytoskeletal protein CcmA (bactofilin family)